MTKSRARNMRSLINFSCLWRQLLQSDLLSLLRNCFVVKISIKCWSTYSADCTLAEEKSVNPLVHPHSVLGTWSRGVRRSPHSAQRSLAQCDTSGPLSVHLSMNARQLILTTLICRRLQARFIFPSRFMFNVYSHLFERADLRAACEVHCPEPK